MTGTELIPAPAWEQAVYVCLFIVFAIWLWGSNAKQNRESRDFHKNESDANREFQKAESDKWQKFIANLSENYQKQNSEDREKQNCAMEDVNASLANLTKTTGDLAHSVEEMRSDLKDHDKQAKEILQAVSKPAPKPRVKAQ